MGRVPPAVVVAANSVAQAALLVTQASATLLSALNVGSVEVRVPFGAFASTAPTAPVCTSARLPAIGTALAMPIGLPPMALPATNWAKALAVATVVRSFTVTRAVAAPLGPSAAASNTWPRSASTNRTGVAVPGRRAGSRYTM